MDKAIMKVKGKGMSGKYKELEKLPRKYDRFTLNKNIKELTRSRRPHYQKHSDGEFCKHGNAI